MAYPCTYKASWFIQMCHGICYILCKSRTTPLHHSWLIFLIARYTPNLNKVSSTIFDVIGFVLGTRCITHSCSSQMKNFHVTFLIWIMEVVIRSLEWHGEVTKIGVIKCYSQQCPTTDDKKGWVNPSLA